jgi:type III secretory pathway component EscT
MTSKPHQNGYQSSSSSSSKSHQNHRSTMNSVVTLARVSFHGDGGIPYVLKIPRTNVTLADLKHHMPSKGDYSYFFKQMDETTKEAVMAMETEDKAILPIFKDYIECVCYKR